MANQNCIAELVLQTAIDKRVGKELGQVIREMSDLLEGAPQENKNAAKLLVLEMVRNASDAFYGKMSTRINKKASE